MPVPVPAVPPTHSSPALLLLSDEQAHVEGHVVHLLRHIAFAIFSPTAVEQHSTIEVGRAPTDHVLWHFVRRKRGDQVTDLLPSLQLRVIQPEAGRDEGVLDGRLREVAVLEDIRAGDEIEYAYTLVQSAVLPTDHVYGRYALGYTDPVERLSLRVDWPQSLRLSFKLDHAEVTHPTPSSLAFLQDHVPAYEHESDEPVWFDPTPSIELSEFKSWAEVAAADSAFYPPVPKLSEDMEQLVAPWKQLADPEAKMTAAVRFVQDEVRYLGIEEGARAVVPSQPGDVLRRRYGDCKDKSYLLVTLLRALGFEADPAYVSTVWRQEIAHMLPAEGAFDHVIVRAQLGKRTLWIDATRRLQRGSIARTPGLPFGVALVLRKGEQGLQELPQVRATLPDIAVLEQYDTHDRGGATLRVTTTYAGDQADHMRARIDAQSPRELEDSYLSFYEHMFHGIEVLAPLKVSDRTSDDVLVVEEAYRFKEFWSDDEASVEAWSIADWLPTVASTRKPVPLAIAFPLRVRHVIELNDENDWRTDPEQESVEASAFSLSFRAHPAGTVERLEFELRSKGRSVPADQLAQYRSDRDKAHELLVQSFVRGTKAKPRQTRRERKMGLVALGLIAAVLAIAASISGARRWLSTRRRRRFERGKRFAAGEAPQFPIEVDGRTQALAALTRVECCGQRPFQTPPEPETVRFAGAALQVYRMACASCGTSHRRYFRTRAPERE